MKEKQFSPQERLRRLFRDIKDPHVRDIISEVVTIEAKYRSAQKFPLQQIRDVVDNNARLIEMHEKGREV
jgi:hypothetical protein